MARAGSNVIPLIAGVIIAFIIIAIVITTTTHFIPLPVGGFSIFGRRLTEEVTPPQVLYSSTLTLQPGQVWRVTYDANGIHVTRKSSHLIEVLNLSNVDLSVNDVIAPHLYDWYFDGVDDYVLYRGFSTSNFSYLYVDTSVDAEVRNSKVFVSWVPYKAASIYFGITSSGRFWYETWNSTSTSILNGRISSFIFGAVHGYQHVQVVQTSQQIAAYVNGVKYTYTPLNSGPVHWLTYLKVGTLDGTAGSTLKGRIAYIYISRIDTDTLPSNWRVITNPVIFIDSTFYNGSKYLDLVSGVAGTPYGGVVRVPAEHTWLWLVKGLANDNVLHIRYAPPGSTLVIKYNGMIYQWRITGTPNQAGLIPDYKIDLASIFGTTVLPNATVELIYPSEKVRFYVPSGFQVEIEGNGWSETHEVPLNSSYVDFGLPSGGTYIVKVLGYEGRPHIRVETSGDVVRVTVTNEAGYALPGAKVYVYDTSGNLVATGYTNDLGLYEFNKSVLSGDQVRLAVTALSNGKYYHADKLVSLSAGFETPTAAPHTRRMAAVASGGLSHGSAVALMVILLLGVLCVAVVLLVRGRKR